ncbi:hypothetical protein RH915_02585 [Serpentinicella sp. ANB-PHB4]|uniref:hypothetical protein n=1 Tax=Serpentinicella sp. ANB-PHB4 TaxID=3074076 RepID=UPI0028562A57|nr:hypothetical protein [Serpentinicella sp. ANB-PHB4]MDR5658368.1 hypothetical protein [Serpentinicella sp. ANB-PHB4]
MLLNTVLGFIIPWIFGVWLILKYKKLVFIIYPFSSVVSHTFNSFGFHAGYWKVTPIDYGVFSALPFDLGLFPLLGYYLIYVISKQTGSDIFLYLSLALALLFLSLLE